MNKVYILILNWNGWKDTIESLESVFRNEYPDYQVIVCDNSSQDGSLEHIKEWAEGRKEAASENDDLRALSIPPVPKPLAYVVYDREQAEAGGVWDNNARLVLIQTGSNLGFAGGNNVGIRYARIKNDFAYVWLLNNDTVIRPDALTHLVRRMREKPAAGMCGSKTPYYLHPDRIWSLGGATYNKWLALPRNIGLNGSFEQDISISQVEGSLAFITGASMLVSRDFLADIGLLCEKYFLFFEELDWALRGRGRYELAYAPESVVYHKVNASVGPTGKTRKYNKVAEYYMTRNSIIITYKFYPLALPIVVPFVIARYFLKRFIMSIRRSISQEA